VLQNYLETLGKKVKITVYGDDAIKGSFDLGKKLEML